MLRLLRQISAVVAKELTAHYPVETGAQPGRIFFPKHVHELGPLEGEAPNGLSIEYVRLALAKNRRLSNSLSVDAPVTTLAVHVSEQIGQAVLLERRLLERLQQLT
jgi:hypothetical protein